MNKPYAGFLLLWVFLVVTLVSAAGAQTIAVSGTVVDQDDNPIADATVTLQAIRTSYQADHDALTGASAAAADSTRSDETGRYLVEAPQPGMWRLVVARSGYLTMTLDLSPLLAQKELLPVLLPKREALRVSVRDHRGEPVPNALVQLHAIPQRRAFGVSRAPALPLRQSQRTDQAGEASLSGTAGGEHIMLASAQGFAPWRSEEPKIGRTTVSLKEGVERKLQVADGDGKPVRQAVIRVGGLSQPVALTDEHGVATIRLSEGDRNLIWALGADGRVAFSEAEAKTGPAVKLVATLATLEGSVVSTTGRAPLEGAWVYDSTDSARFVRTAKDGSYQLPVTPRRGGRHVPIAASALDYFGDSARVDHQSLVDGSAPILALRPGGKVRGVVLDSGGQPIADALVKAEASGPQSFSFRDAASTRSNKKGQFQLTPLELDQAFALVARRKGYSPARADVGKLTAGQAPEVILTMSAGRRATGTVVDGDDLPVAGVEVLLTPSIAGNDLQALVRRQIGQDEPLRGWTDAEGRFELLDLEPGRYDLRAEASGFAPAKVPAIEIPDRNEPTEIGTIALSPGVSIEGIVTDADGVPLEGAEVHAKESGSGIFRFSFGQDQTGTPDAASDQDGRFEIVDQAEGQAVELQIKLDGYADATVSGIRPPTLTPLEVQLEVASTISGIVVNESGDGVRANLMLMRQMGSQGGIARAVANMFRNDTSDEQGRFQIKNVTAGMWDLSASGQGYQESKRAGIEVVAGRDPEEVRLVLKKGAVVKGRVLGADGQPIAGASVSKVVQNRNPFQISTGNRGGRSDGEGNYRLDGLPTGATSFTADHDDHQKQVRDLEVRPGDNLLDFRLDPGWQISGRVIDGTGLPIAGASVSSRNPTGGGVIMVGIGGRGGEVTGVDGSFTLQGLSDGSYIVSASKTGYATASTENPIRLQGDSVSGIELRLETGAVIAGQVLGLEFDELSQVQVMAIQPGAGINPALAQANYDGEYRLENLGQGDWMVMAQVAGKSVQETVTLDPGTLEYRLDLEFGGGLTLTGQVLRGDRPVSGYNVFAVGKNRTSSSQSTTDQDGRFKLEGLQEDTYRVAVLNLGGSSHEQEVELTGDRDITIELKESRITGKVIDKYDGSPIEEAELMLSAADEESMRFFSAFGTPPRSDSQGEFSISGVGPGGYNLRATKEGYSAAAAEIRITEGSDFDGVELRMSPSEGLTLIVLTPSGVPATAVNIAALDSGDRPILSGLYQPGEGGRLKLSELPAGSWSLLASSGNMGGATVRVPVSAPGEPVTVRLPEAGGLRITVTALLESDLQSRLTLKDPQGQTYMTAMFGRIQKRFQMANGRAILPALPVGVWTIEVETTDGNNTWSGTARVIPGLTLDVVLE